MIKREDIRDIDVLIRDNDFLDQALRDRLPIGKGEAGEILAQQMAKLVDMRNDLLPVEGLLLCVRELLEFPIHLLQFRGEFLPTEL